MIYGDQVHPSPKSTIPSLNLPHQQIPSMPIRVEDSYIKHPYSVDRRDREARRAVVAGIEVMRDELLERSDLAGTLSLSAAGVAATQSNVDMEHRVGDLHKRRRRNACEAPMVKKVRSHLPEAGLANTHGSLQAWLPESFPGETFGIVGCQWLFIRRLHDRDLVAAAVPEVVRTSEPTVHGYGIDTASDSLHGVPDELFHWSTATGTAQHLNWPARVALVEVLNAPGEAGGGGAPVHGASREKQWGVATNGAEIVLQHKITEHERALLGGDMESELQLPLHRVGIVLPI
ncbi:hypothetical protein C4D60_Mb04t26770 [Musa balbisiana]|uniref:Uncharacterized protein n=1 Tax=Musa balbisiana TaxID=52838 RepID=A0A4S8KF10_MUSBA|nr:hypothetical protein C4D60_Mb04t26770 [Musa balbisiana]